MQWTTKWQKALFHKKKKTMCTFQIYVLHVYKYTGHCQTGWWGPNRNRFVRKPLPAVNLVLSYATKSLYTNFLYSSIFAPKTCLLHHKNRPARKNEDSILIQMVHECIFLKVEKSSMKHFGFAFKIHVLNATPKPLMVQLSTPLSQALPIKW